MEDSRVVQRLQRAVELVERADLPADLRSAGFVLVYQDLDGQESAGQHSDLLSEHSGLQDRLGVTQSELDLVYDRGDDDFSLILPPRALSGEKRAAQAQVARLIVAGRQGSGLEQWTRADVVRDACQDRGVHDSNFSKVLGSLDGRGIRIRGKGASRELSMNARGFEDAGTLIRQLVEALK